jgi:hypothetical protein
MSAFFAGNPPVGSGPTPRRGRRERFGLETGFPSPFRGGSIRPDTGSRGGSTGERSIPYGKSGAFPLTPEQP